MTQQPTNTSIVFVPGAWHTTACYDLVISKLESEGSNYNIVRVELPSVGADPGSAPTWSFLPDVKAVETALTGEVEKGNNVLLVSHSYGSIPTQEALNKYVDSGKVKQIIIAGFLLERGESLIALAQGNPAPWYIRKGDLLDVDNPAEIFYNDLPEADKQKHIAALKLHAFVTKISPQFYPSYLNPSLPTTYVCCSRDQACIPEWQHGMLSRAKDKNGATHIDVRKLDTGHSPFLSAPDEVVKIIEDLAGKR